jgi:hypothetical protein
MSDTPPAPRKGIILLTIVATLAFVFIFERLPALFPTSEYQTRARRNESDYEVRLQRYDADSQARAQRSEALLAAQEQRNKGYQEYYESVRADHKSHEALLTREEQNAARFEKILDRWEQQQKAYQVYLDSLKPPK